MPVNLGKLFIISGLVLIVLGFISIMGDKIPLLGRLPGDIHIQKKNFSFYFPATTSIILSLLLTALFWIFGKR